MRVKQRLCIPHTALGNGLLQSPIAQICWGCISDACSLIFTHLRGREDTAQAENAKRTLPIW